MLKIKRILCPIDLTSDADSALQYAVTLSRTYEAKLYVCHCVESLEQIDEAGTLTKIYEDTIRNQTSDATSVSVLTEAVVMEGDPTSMIALAATERNIDLIVMRSRRRPIAAALLGSTAEAVCRTAPCPVLVIHHNEREWVTADASEIKLKRILVAHDFSNDAEIALKYGSSLAQEYQAELHLVHVLPVTLSPALTRLPIALEAAYQRASLQLRNSIPEELSLWCNVKQTVLTGQPYREILNYAEENQIDLICIGIHGAGFSMRALFGSNTDRVLRQSPCPVLITRPLKPIIQTKKEVQL